MLVMVDYAVSYVSERSYKSFSYKKMVCKKTTLDYALSNESSMPGS